MLKTILTLFLVGSLFCGPVLAASDQEIDTVDVEQLEQIKNQMLSDPAYQQLIKMFRTAVREKFLGNLWRETQRNPDFHFGPLKFTQLFQRLDEFNLFQNMTGTAVQADLERLSDFYIIGGNWGIFNRETVESTPPEMQVALVHHVFLGAAGYQDEDYQLSLALLLLNLAWAPDAPAELKTVDFKALMPATEDQLYRRNPRTDFKASLSDGKSKRSIEELERKLKNPVNKSLQLRGGGFTGVGGGGDGISMQAKLKMIEYMFTVTRSFPDLKPVCVQRWQDPTRFTKDVLEAEVESRKGLKDIQTEFTADQQIKIILPRHPAKLAKMQQIVVSLAVYELCLMIEAHR